MRINRMHEMTNNQAENKRQSIPEGLTMNGFDWHDLRRDETHSGKPLDLELLPETRQVIADHLQSIQTINKHCNSYRLKHIIERFLGQYISNGQLILAMIQEGYAIEKQDRSPNCYFNVSQRSINALREKSRH